ncbi:hypothetical protein M433DRAFT_147988 [Acidomyces richmondensis BFW]|nr:MAG: hypothetical protein FE78DRAFT_68914 [Acidomyces sp. 'richmondensis']KYG41040.1 hypothetical protein M433DRAFT_147988 [Acidomyces richmondensis BFW]
MWNCVSESTRLQASDKEMCYQAECPCAIKKAQRSLLRGCTAIRVSIHRDRGHPGFLSNRMITIPVNGDGLEKNEKLHRAGRLRSSPWKPMLALFFNADLVLRRPDQNWTAFHFWSSTPLGVRRHSAEAVEDL